MNQVSLIGRLTKDPEVRYSASGTAFAQFNLAVSRGKDKSGNDLADFPTVKCIGKTAELVEKYMSKGRLVGITGRLETGSYEKDGRKYYTTDVLADRIEFLEKKGESAEPAAEPTVPEGFAMLTDDDIPFES